MKKHYNHQSHDERRSQLGLSYFFHLNKVKRVSSQTLKESNYSDKTWFPAIAKKRYLNEISYGPLLEVPLTSFLRSPSFRDAVASPSAEAGNHICTFNAFINMQFTWLL